MSHKLRKKRMEDQLTDQEKIDFALEGPGIVLLDAEDSKTDQKLMLRGSGKVIPNDPPEIVSGPAQRVSKKLMDPTGSPTMTVKEAAHTFHKSEKTIYRWLDEGRLESTGVPGRIRTDSVLRLLNPSSEKP